MRFGAGVEGRIEMGTRVSLCESKTTPNSMVQLVSRIYYFQIIFFMFMSYVFSSGDGTQGLTQVLYQ